MASCNKYALNTPYLIADYFRKVDQELFMLTISIRIGDDQMVKFRGYGFDEKAVTLSDARKNRFHIGELASGSGCIRVYIVSALFNGILPVVYTNDERTTGYYVKHEVTRIKPTDTGAMSVLIRFPMPDYESMMNAIKKFKSQPFCLRVLDEFMDTRDRTL